MDWTSLLHCKTLIQQKIFTSVDGEASTFLEKLAWKRSLSWRVKSAGKQTKHLSTRKKHQVQQTVLGMREEKQSSNKRAEGLCGNINTGDKKWL